MLPKYREGDILMAKQMEFFDIQYKEGSLDAKTAEFIKFAVNQASSRPRAQVRRERRRSDGSGGLRRTAGGGQSAQLCQGDHR